MRLRDLSYSYKAPLGVSIVIVMTAVVITSVLMAQAYADSKRELLANGIDLGGVLSHHLRAALLHDEIWEAYEAVAAPLAHGLMRDLKGGIVVLDRNQQIFVSAQPRRFPILHRMSEVDSTLIQVERVIATASRTTPYALETPGSSSIFAVAPILADDGGRLGNVVILFPRDAIYPRFKRIASRAGLATVAVLALLLPIAWFSSKRAIAPLTQLAHCMGRIGRESPASIECRLHAGADEIGTLGNRFQTMLGELRQKEFLEKQVLASERLAAIGRLTAGIAHEINNPLGGMLNAISTFKRHGDGEGRKINTLALIERGLTQIKETVGALLVEAKLESHALDATDIDDVRKLALPGIEEKQLQLEWSNRLRAPIALPSTQIRQIMLNLVLNAARASEPHGVIRVDIGADSGETFTLHVWNGGAYIDKEHMEHLFEPFFTSKDGSSNGLGLWVTYQLVKQLNGEIDVTSGPDGTRFSVVIPTSS